MNKILLFNASQDGMVFHVHATEKNEVVVSAERNGQKVCQDLELVDLSGRKTRVPASILIATQTPTLSEAQSAKLESFKRICLKRFTWSTGCIRL